LSTKRTCTFIIASKDGKRAIYFDDENKDAIINYIYQDERHRKKFLFITEIILNGFKNSALYDKEDINSKCKDVTAMKFFKGQENDRIYCKEIRSSHGSFCIVAICVISRKKSSTLNKEHKAIINKIAAYEYQIQRRIWPKP
jgi:hypothetical protein